MKYFLLKVIESSNNVLLISVISHVIPYSSDEDEADGAPNDPEPRIQSRFHTGSRIHQNFEIRRAGEQTSPQVARAAGHPAQRANAAG